MENSRGGHHDLSGKTYGDGQVIASSEFSDLASVTERSAHDNGLVSELLVVVEDAAHALDTRVLRGGELLLLRCLEPIEDSAHEG